VVFRWPEHLWIANLNFGPLAVDFHPSRGACGAPIVKELYQSSSLPEHDFSLFLYWRRAWQFTFPIKCSNWQVQKLVRQNDHLHGLLPLAHRDHKTASCSYDLEVISYSAWRQGSLVAFHLHQLLALCQTVFTKNRFSGYSISNFWKPELYHVAQVCSRTEWNHYRSATLRWTSYLGAITSTSLKRNSPSASHASRPWASNDV
jgi:hypothetical protein